MVQGLVDIVMSLEAPYNDDVRAAEVTSGFYLLHRVKKLKLNVLLPSLNMAK
jgi:hypothetical protein